MFNHISDKITDSMVRTGTVANEDKEIYLFGVQQGLTIILNIVTTVIIGLLFDVLGQMLLFTVAYIPLRNFAGGYHASTPQRCYILSTLLTIIVSLLIKYVYIDMLVFIGLSMLAGTIIVVFAPIANENKPLDELEKKVYKRKTIVICLVEILIAMLFFGLNILSVSVCLMWTMVTVGIMMIIAKVLKLSMSNKNKYRYKLK
jgi:accessory gene regulator B